MNCEQVKLKSGGTSWVCRADGPRKPDGRRNQIERRGRTQRIARQRVEDEIERQRNEGKSNLDRGITFDELAQEWLAVYAATGVKRGSVRVREKGILVLNKHFKGIKVTDLTHYLYQNMILKLAKDDNDGEPYAHNTIAAINTCANMIFKYAIKNKLIRDNPCTDVTIPKKVKTIEDLENETIESSYFERHELEEFLEVTKTKGLESDLERFLLLAFSGMRPGELCALKKSDLNFENNTIRISKTLVNENNNMLKYRLETTKTGTMRVIDMDPEVMNVLKKLVRKNDKHKMKYRLLLDDFHDEDFLFTRSDGYPYNTKRVGERMLRLLKLTSIKKKLTPHCFRHTHISMMTEAGVDLATIMQRVGHVDPATTLKVYTHVTNKMKSESVSKVTNLHRDILDKLTN